MSGHDHNDSNDHHIEFTLSGGNKVRVWANVIGVAVAILIGVASMLKPSDPVNQASYEELKTAIEANSKDINRQHEDIVSLKNYLEGYMKGVGSTYPIPGPSSSAILVPMDKSKLNGPVIKEGPSNLGTKTVVLIPTVSPPPVPSMGPPPQQVKIPSYTDLKQ